MQNQLNKQYFSILQWLTERGIVNEKGEAFDYYNRPFLLDILTDFAPNQVVMACAQVGKSITFFIKILFAVKHLRFNVIYTMPTDQDVRESVAAKVNKILQANRNEFAGMDSDSIERKEINGRFVFFQGTESETAAISTTADLLVHDEVSRSNQSRIETYKSRIKASPYKGRWLFSNPGTERDELDLAWQKSDQQQWVITCPHCNDKHWLEWPDSVDIQAKCYICRACRQPLPNGEEDPRRPIKGAHWVPQIPSRSWHPTDNPSGINGRRISHLMCPDISVQEIIDDSEGDPAYFNNFVLGKAYSPGDLSVSKTTILDLWTPKNIDTGKHYIGIDVGNIKHYVIRSDKGLLKIGRFSSWEELDNLIIFWKPVAGVIDSNPDNFAARHYVDTYPWMQMSTFQENANNPQTIVWWGERERKGTVYSHRDRILDQFLTNMMEAKWLIGMPTDAMFHLYIKHFETLRREKVTNNKGIERYVWESTTGEDHFVFADLYSYIAMLGEGAGAFYGEVSKSDMPSVLGNDSVYDVSRMFQDNNEES